MNGECPSQPLTVFHTDRSRSEFLNTAQLAMGWDPLTAGLILLRTCGIVKWVCLKMVSTPKNPMVLLIIIPTKWLFHWGYTPFSDTIVTRITPYSFHLNVIFRPCWSIVGAEASNQGSKTGSCWRSQLPKIHDLWRKRSRLIAGLKWRHGRIYFYGFIGFLSWTIQINRYQQHPVACLCFASWLSVELSRWVGSKRPRCARAQIIWHGLWLRITNKKHWLMTPGFVNGLITGKEGNHLVLKENAASCLSLLKWPKPPKPQAVLEDVAPLYGHTGRGSDLSMTTCLANLSRGIPGLPGVVAEIPFLTEDPIGTLDELHRHSWFTDHTSECFQSVARHELTKSVKRSLMYLNVKHD